MVDNTNDTNVIYLHSIIWHTERLVFAQTKNLYGDNLTDLWKSSSQPEAILHLYDGCLEFQTPREDANKADNWQFVQL